jgi:hypothetical protein
MAFTDQNPYAFGLRQIMVVSGDGNTTVELPAAVMVEFSEEHVSKDLDASDKTVASVSFPKKLTWSMEAGGIPLEAMEVMFGETATASGTTPNQKNELTRNAGTVSPFFKMIGRSVGDAGDAVYITIPHCKAGPFKGSFGQEEFFVTKMEGTALDKGSGLYSITQLETDAEIPVA